MILRTVLAVKLHGIKVTNCELYYSGSITLPDAIRTAAGLNEGDQVSIYNFSNGARYDTYVINGPDEVIGINGPSARLCQPGDRIVIAQYVITDEPITPKVLFFDQNNQQTALENVFPGKGPVR